MTKYDKTWQDKTRQDKTRQAKTRVRIRVSVTVMVKVRVRVRVRVMVRVRVGGDVVWEAVEARPGGEGGIGAPRTHDVEGDFGIG